MASRVGSSRLGWPVAPPPRSAARGASAPRLLLNMSRTAGTSWARACTRPRDSGAPRPRALQPKRSATGLPLAHPACAAVRAEVGEAPVGNAAHKQRRDVAPARRVDAHEHGADRVQVPERALELVAAQPSGRFRNSTATGCGARRSTTASSIDRLGDEGEATGDQVGEVPPPLVGAVTTGTAAVAVEQRLRRRHAGEHGEVGAASGQVGGRGTDPTVHPVDDAADLTVGPQHVAGVQVVVDQDRRDGRRRVVESAKARGHGPGLPAEVGTSRRSAVNHGPIGSRPGRARCRGWRRAHRPGRRATRRRPCGRPAAAAAHPAPTSSALRARRPHRRRGRPRSGPARRGRSRPAELSTRTSRAARSGWRSTSRGTV